MYNCLTSWGLFYNGTVPTAFRAGESFAFKQLLLLTLARAQKTGLVGCSVCPRTKNFAPQNSSHRNKAGCVECSVCPRTKLSAARCAADKGQKAKFQATSSLDARTASRRAVLTWMFILCRAAKNEPRKRAKTFPLGSPWHCRSTKSKTKDYIKVFSTLPRL